MCGEGGVQQSDGQDKAATLDDDKVSLFELDL